MERLSSLGVPTVLFAVIVLAGCGGKESVASKSAAAFREAQAKGTPIGGGHEHGGHEASTTTAVASAADPHAGHDMTARGEATDHTVHRAGSAADHASMDHGTSVTTHVGHASAARPDTHAGHAMTTGPTDHAQHQASRTSASDPHAQHGSMPSSPAATTPSHGEHAVAAKPDARPLPAPVSNTQISSIRPAATLTADAF